jgi:hypothetical protein
MLRPTFLFAAAYVVNGVLHESAHASMAAALGVPATLFHTHVDVGASAASATQHALISAAGPVFSGAFGLACAIACRYSRGKAWELLLLYLATLGSSMLFGNLMSASFVGDFGNMANALQLPTHVRWLLSLIGFAGLISVLAATGVLLARWIPPRVSKVAGIVTFIVMPAAAGTLFVVAVYQPMSPAFTSARIAEGLFWLVAVAAAAITKRRAGAGVHRLDWHPVDAIVLLAAVVALRMLVAGIALGG